MEQIEHELRNENFRHWLEIRRVSDTQFNVEKKDSKPVFNESKYVYRLDDGVLECESGSKSCSGAGKSRSTSPSDELDEIIKSLIRERFIKVKA